MDNEIPPLRASILLPMEEWDWDHLTELQKVVLCVPEFPYRLAQLDPEVRNDPELARVDIGGGTTLLHYAAGEGLVGLAETLLAHGADVNACDGEGTPLHYAAKAGSLQMIRLLVGWGATLDVQDARGLEPLYWPCIYHVDDAVRLLLSLGATPKDDYSKDYIARIAATDAAS